MKLTESITLVEVKPVVLTAERRLFWEEWVVRLRSGKYKQGTGNLAKGQYTYFEKSQSVHPGEVLYHCCLGIAAEMYAEKHPDKLKKVREDSSPRFGFKDLISYDPRSSAGMYYGALPGIVVQDTRIPKLGLTCTIQIKKSSQEPATTNLSQLNDAGVPFDKIADIIEFALKSGYKAVV